MERHGLIEKYAKLDLITLGMSSPGSHIGLLSSAAGVGGVFSARTFQSQQLVHPGIRAVPNSFDGFGGSHTLTVD